MTTHGKNHTGIPLGMRTWAVGTLAYSFAGLVVLFGWLLFGDFAWNVRERVVSTLAQLMLKAGGASDTIVGVLVASLPAAFGMLLAPVIGYRSDRFRSRFGRRIPFLLVSTPVAAVSMAGLAFAPLAGEWLHRAMGQHSPGLGVCFLTCFSGCWIAFEVAAITGNNLFLALLNDVVPREVLGRFFGLFRIVSLAVAVGFNYFLVGKAENHLVEMFLAVALVYGVGFSLMCFRVKEGDYPPVSTEEKHEGFWISVRRYFRECFTHPFYLWLFGAIAVAMVAFAPFNTFSIFYSQSVKLSMDDYGKTMAFSFVASALLAYPVGSLADRIHPLRVAIASLVLYVPLCVWGAIWMTTPTTFVVGLVGHVIISGLFFTGTASLGQRLFPTIKFAQFASASQLAIGVLTMLVPPFMGAVLDWNGHAYRLTLIAGAVIAIIATAVFFVVLRFYNSLGGDASYCPPGENTSLKAQFPSKSP